MCWKSLTLVNEAFALTLYQTTKFRLVKIGSICRRQNGYDFKGGICFGKGRKHYGKRRKCWLPASSSFPVMFSKGSQFRVMKGQDHVVRS